jgi:hypothetical protein
MKVFELIEKLKEINPYLDVDVLVECKYEYKFYDIDKILDRTTHVTIQLED